MAEIARSLCRLVGRAFRDLPGSLGSTYLGLWFPSLPLLVSVGAELYRNGWTVMTLHFSLEPVWITALCYFGLFVFCVSKRIYIEHKELTKRANAASDLLGPIPLEALKIAKDLRLLLQQVGPLPEPNFPTNTVEGVAKLSMVWGSHGQRLQAEYKEQFADRVRSITNRLKAAGFPDHVLENYADNVIDIETVERVRARLWLLSMCYEQVDLNGEI